MKSTLDDSEHFRKSKKEPVESPNTKVKDIRMSYLHIIEAYLHSALIEHAFFFDLSKSY